MGGAAPSWVKVGVLSNTIWPREWHVGFFERDGCTTWWTRRLHQRGPWTKPSPLAFQAAMEAVGVSDPAACVYVGDRLFDDVWGAHHAGCGRSTSRTPRSPQARSATPRRADATITSLREVPAVVRRSAPPEHGPGVVLSVGLLQLRALQEHASGSYFPRPGSNA